MRGKHPVNVYRRFVESGMDDPPTNPFEHAREGWLLGSDQFVDRVKRMMKNPRQPDQVPQARRLVLTSRDVIGAVADYYDVCADEYAARLSQSIGRDLAALLAHRRTVATLRDLSHHFGLSHPDSVSNLIRRAENALAKSKTLQSDLKKIDDLLNT